MAQSQSNQEPKVLRRKEPELLSIPATDYYNIDMASIYLLYAPDKNMSTNTGRDTAKFYWHLHLEEGAFISLRDMYSKFFEVLTLPGMKLVTDKALPPGPVQKPDPPKPEGVQASAQGIKFDINKLERDTFHIVEYHGQKYAIRITKKGMIENYSVVES